MQTERVWHRHTSEAAGAGKGKALEEGFACVGAESGWCSCFCGACSARTGSEAEQRTG